MQTGANLFQRIRHRVGPPIGIRPPFRPRLHKTGQQRAQIVFAQLIQQSQQCRALGGTLLCRPAVKQAVAHLVL